MLNVYVDVVDERSFKGKGNSWTARFWLAAEIRSDTFEIALSCRRLLTEL